MKWASSISTKSSLDSALEDAVSKLREALAPHEPDVVFAFVSTIYGANSVLSKRLQRCFPQARIFGSTAGGVAGGGKEVEQDIGLSLIGAVLPDVGIEAVHLTNERTPNEAADPAVWHDLIGLSPEHQPVFVLLPDPFSIDPQDILTGLDRAYPNAPKAGGLVSGGRRPGEHALFFDDAVHRSGALCIALYGDVALDVVVARGCRPVGIPFTVTRGHQNLIHELNEQKVLTTLEILFEQLDEHDQRLFRRSPMLGLAIDSQAEAPRHRDWLIRAVQGVSRQSGALALNGAVQSGQRVQFHVRDPVTAAHELRSLLADQHSAHTTPPAGALMFNCLGRGKFFYGQEHHDTTVISEELNHLPVGGFFCNGEFGPLHGQTHFHSYTAVIALFRPRGWS